MPRASAPARCARRRGPSPRPSDHRAVWPTPSDVVTLRLPVDDELLGALVQGVVKSYDAVNGVGVVVCDTDLEEYELADGALAGSVFRTLRQGQRIVFDLDDRRLATSVRLGSEVDMGTRGFGDESER